MRMLWISPLIVNVMYVDVKFHEFEQHKRRGIHLRPGRRDS